MSTRPLRIDGRTEALLLVPATLLLLVGLSLVVLFGYRGAVEQLLETRADEADRIAARVAEDLGGSRPSEARLRALAPEAWAVAVVDSAGVPVVVSGDLAVPGAPVDRSPSWWTWFLPPASPSNVITATASLVGTARGERRDRIRVDLPALVLRSKARSLRVLVPLVLVVDMAVVALVLIYLGRLLGSFDRLVATARRASAGEDQRDDVEVLLATFERAVEALERPEEPPSEPATTVDSEADDRSLAAFQRTLARSMASGLLLLDDTGVVLALNAIGADLLGIAEPQDDTDLESVAGAHPPLLAMLEGAVARQQSVKREELDIEVAGEARTIGLTVHPLRRDDGAVRGFLVLFSDLTTSRREAAKKQLDENLSQVGALAAGVAHEMRNGLATLRGYLGLIERARDGDGIGDYLLEIRREGDHLERVLDDFLQFARPGSARPSPVDLTALVRRCTEDPALGAGTVRLLPADRGVIVRADADLVERAIRNLLLNAVQAQARAERTEPVEVAVIAAGASVSVQVDDRGPGLSAEAARHLFEPFATTRAGGVGLGLALSRRIAVLHGGELLLVSRPSGGARATLRLPVEAGETVTDGSNSPEGRASR